MIDKHRACNICGSIDSIVICPKCLNRSYYRCNTCGHEWLSDYVDQKEFYEDESHFFFSQFSHWISSYIARQRIDMVKRHLKSGLLLEIGPGTGEVIMAAESEGFDVMAVEPSSFFVKYLRSKTKATVFHGLLENVDFGETKFDGILSFHVLEHVLDPTRYLQRAVELLKPGGYLLFATPSTSSWDRRLFKNRWTGYSPGHLNLFSLSSIQLCLKHAGWRVVDIHTFESPIALLWSIKVGIKPKEITPEYAGSNIKRVPLKLGRIILLFFGALTKPLRFVQQQLSGGNELFVIAQKDKP